MDNIIKRQTSEFLKHHSREWVDYLYDKVVDELKDKEINDNSVRFAISKILWAADSPYFRFSE